MMRDKPKSEKKAKGLNRRDVVMLALKATGHVVVASNVIYFITHTTNKDGNNAGAK